MDVRGDQPVMPGLTELGLTKRELFSALVLVGLVSRTGLARPDNPAEVAVEYADTLIRTLNKRAELDEITNDLNQREEIV